jgi:hypothetical protein
MGTRSPVISEESPGQRRHVHFLASMNSICDVPRLGSQDIGPLV